MKNRRCKEAISAVNDQAGQDDGGDDDDDDDDDDVSRA